MKTFYERQRKTLSILVKNDKPIGGQWSFDEDNRKKIPKQISFPPDYKGTQSKYINVNKKGPFKNEDYNY